MSARAAIRRYFDKSSLTFANATSRNRGSLLFEPFLRLRFRDDGKDLDCCFLDVIKDPNLTNPQAILRSAQASQPFNPAFAYLCRFVTEVYFASAAKRTPDLCRQPLVLLSNIRSQYYVVSHSGYIMARFYHEERPADFNGEVSQYDLFINSWAFTFQ